MINSRTNELILAHCTIGLKQTERYIIRNHFETEKGIAIQGVTSNRRRNDYKNAAVNVWTNITYLLEH